MARGRKPEITALPGALDKTPPTPAWLPRYAKAEWKRVVPAMVRSRSLAAHELSTVESYCIAVARIRECEKVIQKSGLTFISPTGESKRRPESTLAKENIEAARRLAAELGIRQRAAVRIKAALPTMKTTNSTAWIFADSACPISRQGIAARLPAHPGRSVTAAGGMEKKARKGNHEMEKR
jgi:P27 family predicted phage terminase small subunit